MKRLGNLTIATALLLTGAAGCEGPEPEGSSLAMPDLDDPAALTDRPEFDDQVAPTPEDLAASDDYAASEEGTLRAEIGAPTIHYINFSDGTMVLKKSSVDDATKNTSFVCGSGGRPYPKYTGTDTDKKKLVSSLATMMADFNIVLTTSRPASGVYSMELVGPAGSECPGGGAGVGPMDCGNRNKANISFTFLGGVVTTAQESGHAFGLEHVDVACDVMGAGYSSKGCPGGKWGYPDVDGAVLSLGQPTCGSQTQNSYQMMKKVLGDWPGGAKPDPMGDGGLCADQLPPVVEITSPRDGETVGNDFRVEASAGDDCNVIKQVRIEVPAEGLDATSETAPFAWNLTGVADTNDLQIIVHATDASGKESDAATIHVKVGAGAGGGNNDPGAGGQGGGSGEQGDATSGGCSLAGHPAVATLPLLPLLLLSRPRVVRRKPPA